LAGDALRSRLRALRPAAIASIQTYRQVFGRWPNIVRPKTFNEKVLYRKLFDRRPILKVWSDKVAVRAFVRERLGGDEHLIPVIATYSDAAMLDPAGLPDRFVMKASHGSAWVKVFRPDTPRDPEAMRGAARSWLATDFGVRTGEWGYRGIPRNIVVETLLEDRGALPNDYKFYCFDGKPRLLIVANGRFTDLRAGSFDMDFRPLGLRQWQLPLYQGERPASFGRMAEIASILSAGTDFVRVDLYEANGKVFFGELTSYPMGGTIPFDPPEWDAELGRMWKQPRRYR